MTRRCLAVVLVPAALLLLGAASATTTAATDDALVAPARVYGRAVRDGRRLWLQYRLF